MDWVSEISYLPIYPRYMWLCFLFSAVNKAYKTLENEEGLKRCAEIVEEARSRTNEMVSVCSVMSKNVYKAPTPQPKHTVQNSRVN